MLKICSIPGCGQPRMIGKSGKPLTYCEAHQREAWREQAARKRAGQAQPRTRSTTCKTEGCNEPRYQFPNGRLSSYCATHTKEYQRGATRKARAAAGIPQRRAVNLRAPIDPAIATPTTADAVPLNLPSPDRGEGPGVRCPMCNRTPRQAAYAALTDDSWCYYCTWIDTPHAELERRAYGDPAPAPAGDCAEQVQRLTHQIAAERAKSADLHRRVDFDENSVPLTDCDMMIVDLTAKQIRYMRGSQVASTPIRSKDQIKKHIQTAAVRGFAIGHKARGKKEKSA